MALHWQSSDGYFSRVPKQRVKIVPGRIYIKSQRNVQRTVQMPVIFRIVMAAIYILIGASLLWRYVDSNTAQLFDLFAGIASAILAIMTLRKNIFPLDFAGVILTLTCIFSAIGFYSGYDESGLSYQKKNIWMATAIAIDVIYLYTLWRYKVLIFGDASSAQDILKNT